MDKRRSIDSGYRKPGLLFRRLAAIAAGVVIVIAVAVLIGWMFEIEPLMTVLPGFIRMKSMTALGLLAAAAAILAEFYRARTIIRYFCALIPTTIGAATLFEYFTGRSLNIDQMFFLDPVQKVYPGRMAHLTAVNLVILGIALLLRIRTRPPRRTSVALALLVIVFSMLAIVGYLYGVPLLYGSLSYTAMALHTGISFLLLSLAVLFIDPAGSVVRLIWSENAGGIVARRLLPWAIVSPIVVGGFFVSPAFNFREIRMGMALQAMVFAVLFASVIIHLCRSLNTASGATIAAEEAMMFDGLTGVHNRRYFDRRMADEIERCQRDGASLSLVLFDADHFKTINDEHGHLTGDEVLKAIASLASMTLRASDALCRYGGEEFALILPQASIDDARVIAERVR
ncbi:MAG: GGDEF domain-containing protein, partial [Thermoanaerobaculia bacterium]